MPPMISFLSGRGFPISGVTDSAGIDPSVTQVMQLLEQLEMGAPPLQPPQPQPVGPGRRILGSLGDAILAMAAVRAGGGPPPIGPFAAGQREREEILRRQQEEYEKRRAENEAANRTLRNQIRIQSFEERARRERELELARLKGQMVDPLEEARFLETRRHNLATEQRMEGRRRTRIVYDMKGNAYEQDVDTSQVKPIELPGGAQAGKAASEEAQNRAAATSSFLQGIDQLKKALPSFIQEKGGGLRIGQQIARRTPIVGAQISERISSQGEQIAALRDRVMADFTRIMSGLQASEMEQSRLQRILPDLGTVDAETAINKIEQFEQAVLTYVKEKQRMRPDLFKRLEGVEETGSTVDDILRQIDEERNANPTP